MSSRKPKKVTQSLSDTELKEFSREHLHYEIVMVARLARSLAALLTAVGHDKAIENALIESFSVHLRNLIEFLYGDAEVKADFYFADPIEDWRKKRTRKSVILEDAHQRASKQVQHLTLSRTKKPAEKEWPIVKIMHDLKIVLDEFAKNADPARVDPAVSNVISLIDPTSYPKIVTDPSSGEPGPIHTAAPLINTVKGL